MEVRIVGAGLAGTCLGLELEARGVAIHILGRVMEGAASPVARGVMHPWKARGGGADPVLADLVPRALAWYRDRGDAAGLDAPVLPVPFRWWDLVAPQASGDAAPGPSDQEATSPRTDNQPESPRGFPLLPGWTANPCPPGWRLPVEAFLEAVHRRWKDCGIMEEGLSAHGDVAGVRATDRSVVTTVWCEGWRMVDNPLWLGCLRPDALKPAFGQSGRVRIAGTAAQAGLVLRRGIWLEALGGDVWHLGASNSWDMAPLGCRGDDRTWLEGQVHSFGGGAVTWLDEAWGIRPASRDRLPLAGTHPTEKNQWLINGLGARGCLWAPVLAEAVAECLVGGRPIPGDWDVSRMYRT